MPQTVASRPFLEALDQRAAASLAELTRALRAHQQSRSAPSHGALVLAVAAAKRAARLLASVRERPLPPGDGAAPVAMAHLLARLDAHRAGICRALSEAAAAVDTGAARADTADALRSLMQTRAMLGGELRKVQGAVDELAGSSEALQLLQGSLTDVNATVDVAQRIVRRLVAVKSKDDAVLLVSIAVFVLVVLYILVQRIFGFFPTRI